MIHSSAWVLVLMIEGLLAASAHGQAKPAKPAPAPRLESVTFMIGHRVFHDFRDLQTVKLNQDFILGDTEYTGRVVQYVPEFEMDLASRKVISRSQQPKNPAFKVVVRKGKTPQDTTWAFLNMPPHFGRNAYFAFKVARIDFIGHAPMIADTTKKPALPEAPVRIDPSFPRPPATKDTLKRR